MYWNLDHEGTMRISGNGKMDHYSCGKNPTPPWNEFKDQIRKVIIDEGITELGIRAFEGCQNLTHVELPASVKRIHYGCFGGCVKLTEISTAPNTEFRFVYDEMNPSIDKKKEIIFGINSFYGTLWALEKWGNFYIYEGHLMSYFSTDDKVIIPEGTETIEKFAFSNAPITEVQFPESIRRIEMFAFEDTALDRIDLPEGLDYIGYGAFMGSSVRKAVFSRARLNIDPDAFRDTCIDLTFHNGNLPSIYEVAACSCGISGYGKLRLQEKYAETSGDTSVSENGADEEKRGVAGVPRIHVGREIFRKIQGDFILISIRYDKIKKQVLMVNSILWNRDRKRFYEYFIYPCSENEQDYNESFSWEDALIFMDKQNFLHRFSGTVSSEKRIQQGFLSNQYDGEEEWYCTSQAGNVAGTAEWKFLYEWMQLHPEYRQDCCMKIRRD